MIKKFNPGYLTQWGDLTENFTQNEERKIVLHFNRMSTSVLEQLIKQSEICNPQSPVGVDGLA